MLVELDGLVEVVNEHDRTIVQKALGRLPVRPDVYKTYAGQLLPWIDNPYEAGRAATMDLEMRNVRFNVLRQLVRSAAVENLADLRAARRKLLAAGGDAQLLAKFNSLPDNVATREKIRQVAQSLKDPAKAERIVAGWTAFFAAVRFSGIAPAAGRMVLEKLG